MTNTLKNLGFCAMICVLFAVATTVGICVGGPGSGAAIPAFQVANGPNMPPDPWEVANGPNMPPDPWEVANGPNMPPDPWEVG